MIKKIKVTNYLGDSLEIELTRPEQSGLLVTSIEGLGPATATINSVEMSMYDGGLFNSARLSSRNIVLGFKYVNTDTESIEDVRIKTYKYFPIKKPLTFEITTDSRTAYCIGYVETNEPEIFSQQSGCQISIICPDPYFYSSGNGGITETVFSGLVYEFEFPFENNSLTFKEIEMGDIRMFREHAIEYDGDAEIGIVITIHSLGMTGDITIYNIGTRESMKILNDKIASLTGAGISAGDTITISTVKGSKSIKLLRGGVETNILNVLDKNSSWFQLSKGSSIFTYTAEESTTALQFKITNQTLYEGV